MSTGGRRGPSRLSGLLAALAVGAALTHAAAPAAAEPTPAPAARLRILSPTENAVLLPGDVYVIGAFSGEGAALVQVALDGKLAKFVTATGGGFWCKLTLWQGAHAIRVASGAEQATLSISVSSSGGYAYHPKVENCDGCHPRRGGPFKPDVPLPRLCGKCHRPRDGGKFVHGPVAAGGCSACHDPHGAPNPRLQKVALPCFSCHPPFPAAARVHAPLKRGECVSCHSPHSADDRALLVPAGNALCVSCHREFHAYHRAPVQQGSMTRVPEDFPRDKGTLACSGCHAAHQSNEKFLLKVSAERLCKGCHG